MKSYDLVYVIRPDMDQGTTQALMDRVAQRITDQGGSVDAVVPWGKRRMSYTLKKNREGLYIHTRFSVDPSKVAEIRRAVSLMEELLRATITNAVGKLPEVKSVEAVEPAAAPAPVPAVPPEPSVPPPPGAPGAERA